MPLTISVQSRHTLTSNLERRFPGAIILDVTSRGSQPWLRFSPFYPHGGIPVPFSPETLGASVEGIWQALKVFEKSDIDVKKLAITTMKGIKRSSRSYGKVLGHRAGIDGDRLLSYLEARKQIYLPSYLWVLENFLGEEIEKIRHLAANGPILLLDYETNCDVLDLTRPLSHAGLIKRYAENAWPKDLS